MSVVDDDESVRESLPALLGTFGFAAQGFASAEEFLASERVVGQTRCLILDIGLPGMSGPDLLQELALRQFDIPIVFITAQRDETTRLLMLGLGAVECLFKPFSADALASAVQAAVRGHA